jgi:hypothetical protein
MNTAMSHLVFSSDQAEGSITRQGMAAGLGSNAAGAEFMEDFIANFAAGYRVSPAQGGFATAGDAR